MAKKQPGTMLYFDIRPSLKRLSNEEKGLLFEAILDYGEFGVVPELDGPLGVAWDFIQPRLDRDRERYEHITEKRRSAANARWGNNAQSDANASKSMQMDANAFFAMQTMPTTTPTSTPTSSSTTTSTPTPTGGDQQSRPKTKEQQFEDLRAQRMRMLAQAK